MILAFAFRTTHLKLTFVYGEEGLDSFFSHMDLWLL